MDSAKRKMSESINIQRRCAYCNYFGLLF